MLPCTGQAVLLGVDPELGDTGMASGSQCCLASALVGKQQGWDPVGHGAAGQGAWSGPGLRIWQGTEHPCDLSYALLPACPAGMTSGATGGV